MFTLENIDKRGRKIGADGRRPLLFSKLNFEMPDTPTSVAILGPRQSGKTTLTSLIVGADFPDSGAVRRRGSISFPLASGAAMNRLLTITETCAFLARIYGLRRSVLTDFVADLSGLGAWMDRLIGDLDYTKGAKLRYAVSYAIPFDCYIADTWPVVGDEKFRAGIAAVLAERRKTSGFFFLTRSRRAVREYAHVAGVIQNQRIVMYPTLEAAIAAFDLLDREPEGDETPAEFDDSPAYA
jgi:capsular polysaccharide transport system ATP-binding protein